MTHPHPDPWQEAADAQPISYTHFGQISVTAENVIWPSNTRLADCPPFDVKQHNPEDRVVRVTILATPLPGRSNPFPHERVIPIYSRDWVSVTLPSLKALGVAPRELDGRWAKYQFKKSRTYTDKNTGQEKEATSFHFVELYDTEDAAIKAADAFFASLPSASADEIADEIPGFEASGDDGKAADPERAAMAQFLTPIWLQCNGDQTALAKKIAEMPMLAQYFTIDAPEVKAVIAANPF